MTETVNILNRRPTILHLPPVLMVNKGADGTERPEVGDSVSLMPGSAQAPTATPVPVATWERAQKNRSVADWLRLDWIRVAKPEDDAPTKPKAPSDLAHLSGPAAIALVETESDEGVLRMWQAAESREPVKAAIGKKLPALKK